MKKVILAAALLLVSLVLDAQQRFTYSWKPVPMDSCWNEIKDTRATEIIAGYASQLDSLLKIIGYTDEEYSSHRPESGLSNMAADVIRLAAERHSGVPVDIAITNFGGIRTSLPKGAVRIYDIWSIFPFDNQVVYFDIKGSDLRKVLYTMIGRNKIEALSNVEIEISGHKVTKMLVAGAPINDSRIYKLSTIDFLMTGGDGLKLNDYAINRVNTGVMIRDEIGRYIQSINDGGNKIELKSDGRVRYVNMEE